MIRKNILSIELGMDEVQNYDKIGLQNLTNAGAIINKKAISGREQWTWSPEELSRGGPRIIQSI